MRLLLDTNILIALVNEQVDRLADAMHGAAGSMLGDILATGGTRVVPFRAERDVLFGGVHPEPIAANLSAAAARIREERCDLGVAWDGDADRLGVLDGSGRFVSPHRILALLLLHAFRRRGLSGGIAKTFSTSLLIDRVAQKLGAPVVETPIGFKYVAEHMNSGAAVAGGEESGGYAFAFHLPERDGIVRRVPIIMEAQGVMVPSLSIELLRVVTNSGAILVRTDQAGVQSVAVPGLEASTDQNGRFWVHFNRHDPARYVSAKDVLQGRVPRDRIEGKLVLIGTSAVGLLDVKTTPVAAAMPGVEVHAQVVESVLTNSLLTYPNYAIGAELLVAVLGGLAIIIAAPMLRASIVIALGAILVTALIGASWYLYSQYNLLIDFTYPLMSIGFVYLTLIFVNYFQEQKQRQQIRAAFGFYLSPALVEQLARSPEKLVLGGEERRMTVLFSDVRGFTTISESYKHDPQGLTRLMNRFLTPLTNAIIERNGTIDKYIGDAIMAFWNAPLDDPQQEVNACEAALEMLARADKLNQEFKREANQNGGKYMPLRIGIGLNTGPCVVGNMGSDFRFNYSVLGDTVNVASRLEARTKDYRIPIVIGEATAQKAKERFATMEIDRIQVKGKTQPETVFTVLGRAELGRNPDFLELHELTTKMLRYYREQNWTQALDTIEPCRKAAEGFGVGALYDMYAARIEAFRHNPPPPDWNGVYEAESK